MATIQNGPQTLGDYLTWAANLLRERIIETPQLDAELLLAHVLKIDRPYLISHADDVLEPQAKIDFFQLIERRLRYEPIAYILGRREFYGRTFILNQDVLIPRPESELLVDFTLKILQEGKNEPVHILDLGTGSGILGITLAAEHRAAKIVATDISSEALQVAKQNAQNIGVSDRIVFSAGDLFNALDGLEPKRFDFIVTNPPYLNPSEKNAIQADIRDFEPDVALFSPKEGLAIIEKIAQQAEDYLKPGGILFSEIGFEHEQSVFDLFSKNGNWINIEILRDLSDYPRVIKVMRKEA